MGIPRSGGSGHFSFLESGKIQTAEQSRRGKQAENKNALESEKRKQRKQTTFAGNNVEKNIFRRRLLGVGTGSSSQTKDVLGG